MILESEKADELLQKKNADGRTPINVAQGVAQSFMQRKFNEVCVCSVHCCAGVEYASVNERLHGLVVAI